tara:strand:+ start:1534 stop:2541 length:1008 start_codon:yes stop_codon:yes gene_type:complete
MSTGYNFLDMLMGKQRPQQDGALGMQRPEQLFSPLRKAGIAADSLILRGYGQGKNLREQGIQQAQFQQQQNQRTDTIKSLEQRAAAGDALAGQILTAVKNRSLSVSDAMKIYFNQKFNKTGSKVPSKIQMYEYAINQLGKTPEEAEIFANTAPTTTINTGATIEKMMAEEGIKYTNQLYSKADTANAFKSTIDRQLDLLDDPNFDAGTGSALITGAKGLLQRFGLEGAEPASNQEFVALMNRQILNSLGGSLGVGVSNADVMFLQKMTANPDMSPRAIERMLLAAKAMLKREEELRGYARQWMTENNVTYISDPYKFRDDAKKFFDNKPLEFPRG